MLKTIAKIIAYILCIVLILFLICLSYWGLRSYLRYKEAYDIYTEKCEYIKENEQAFIEFSEYCLSFVENEDNDIQINAENLWDKNENGKTVWSAARGGKAFYRTDIGYVAHYNYDISPYYSIDIIYSHDIVRRNEIDTNDKRHCVINDDMYAYLNKIPHA